MIKEALQFLFENVAEKTARTRVGELVKLAGPPHVEHFIDANGAVVKHVAPPDCLSLQVATVDTLVDYLVEISKVAVDSEGPRNWSIDDVDVFITQVGAFAHLDRKTTRDILRAMFTQTAAAKSIENVGRPDEDENRAIGSKTRQADLVRFFDLDLRGYVDAGVVKKFEQIRWSGGDIENTTVMRDKSSMGREIETRALATGSGVDPTELPDFVDVKFPYFDDPIFRNVERWSSVRMFIFPDLQSRSIELVVRPDELTDARISAVQHVVTFIRDNIEARTGSKSIRIVGG